MIKKKKPSKPYLRKWKGKLGRSRPMQKNEDAVKSLASTRPGGPEDGLMVSP